MTDISAIQVLNFSGSKDEWPTWSDKFLSKIKRSGTKDVLLVKTQIPKTLDVMNDKTDEGKRMLKITELNQIAFTELALALDVSRDTGKIAFIIIKSVRLSWETLKKKFEPISISSLIKTERKFRES